VNFYVGIIDYDWFRSLTAQLWLDAVSFRQSGDWTTSRIPLLGKPFLLLSPHVQSQRIMRRGLFAYVGFAAAVICSLAACTPSTSRPAGTPSTPSLPAPRALRTTFTQVGLASWYGSAHAGHRTASGELFDPDAMTAAHRSLPFGVVVNVTNVENGRAVTVRINDRGPQDTSRIIDLSRAAADALGFRAMGTARVRIERLESE